MDATVTTGNANGTAVEHPLHYNAHPSGLECIDITRLCMNDVGNSIKYVWRAELKNDREDLEKSLWYMQDAVSNGTTTHPDSSKNKLRERLDKVIAAEPEAWKRRFYLHIAASRFVDALKELRNVLGVDPAALDTESLKALT